MRAPISWLAEYVELPERISARAVADALIRVGLEVEGVHEWRRRPVAVRSSSGGSSTFDDEPQKNGKVDPVVPGRRR